MTNFLKTEIVDDIAVLTLNDPDKLNALSMDMISELHMQVKAINSGELKVRCAVLTGAGRGFCAGANLVEGASLGDNIDPGETLEKVYHPFLVDLKNLNVPLITAVNGVAAGAGCSLGVFGDLVYASKSAYFYQAFKFIGLVPCLLYTSPSPRDISGSRMPSSA